jgi:transcriptional regulator with XRE-family HTH domain
MVINMPSFLYSLVELNFLFPVLAAKQLKQTVMPGSIIRQYRELRNYSQDYVAKKMGISQNAYSKIENNITQLTVKHIKLLSGILEAPVTDLLKDEFEIHRPGNIQMESITRESLLQAVEQVKGKIAEKPFQKHEFFPVVMSLLQTIDNTLSSTH